jgi:hypothetical protein
MFAKAHKLTVIIQKAAPRVEANISSITGAGHYTIYQCYNSVLAWRTASAQWRTSSAQGKIPPATTVIPSKVVVTVLLNTKVPTISRCDKVVIIPSDSATPISLTFNDSWTKTSNEFPTPVPNCTIKEHQCDQAYTAYSTKTYSFISSVYSTHFASRKSGLPGSINFQNLNPPCEAPLPTCPPTEEVANCKLEARRGATVYYWPTSVSGDFCGAKVTEVPTPTAQGRPNIAVYDSITITSPSPLVVVPGVTRSVLPPASMVAEESDIYYRPCGYAKDVKFPVDPSFVSSIRTVMVPTKTVRHNYTFSTQYSSTTKPFSFNFVDMNEGAVPWEAFLGSSDCRLREHDMCNNLENKTITPRQYRPELSLTNITANSAEAGWTGCTIPNMRDNVKFVPITAPLLAAPSVTHYGATVSVGPITPNLEPSPTWSPLNVQQMIDSFPENDFYPAFMDLETPEGDLMNDANGQSNGSATGEMGVSNGDKVGEGASGATKSARPRPANVAPRPPIMTTVTPAPALNTQSATPVDTEMRSE